MGLEEVFRSLQDSRVEDTRLKEELVRRIKAYNHIPAGLDEEYAKVLLEEFRRWLSNLDE